MRITSRHSDNLRFLGIFFIVASAGCASWTGHRAGSAGRATASDEAGTFLQGLDRNAGAAGMDLGDMDFSGTPVSLLAEVVYDDSTIWPPRDRMPADFSPAEWMQDATYHGLGVAELNAAGLTGKGVSIAVFDKPMNAAHSEFSGRIEYVEVGVEEWERTYHFHGISCASIIAGKTCGVAPEATLYYFAVPDDRGNFANYCEAMDRLLEINGNLPESGKIRLVSVSDGLDPKDPLMERWKAAVAKAEKAGVDVNYANGLDPWRVAYGGCLPSRNRDDPSQYEPSRMLEKVGWHPSLILVPSDYRTTADNEGGYRYWPQGGFSWSIAYISGLSALAYQANPGIRFPMIMDLLRKTKQAGKGGKSVIDPKGFIEAVRKAGS